MEPANSQVVTSHLPWISETAVGRHFERGDLQLGNSRFGAQLVSHRPLHGLFWPKTRAATGWQLTEHSKTSHHHVTTDQLSDQLQPVSTNQRTLGHGRIRGVLPIKLRPWPSQTQPLIFQSGTCSPCSRSPRHHRGSHRRNPGPPTCCRSGSPVDPMLRRGRPSLLPNDSDSDETSAGGQSVHRCFAGV